MGMLDASGNPAAACSSLIGELQNPLINPVAFLPTKLRTHWEVLCIVDYVLFMLASVRYDSVLFRMF